MTLYTHFDAAGVPRCYSDRPEVLPGHTAIEGRHDPMRVRLDLSTGHVVPYQPPAPADDGWTTWAWDAEAWAWIASPTTSALARDARSERDRRLAACDWTQLPDVPSVTSQSWAAYRQALRDITAQAGFPASINWPSQPE